MVREFLRITGAQLSAATGNNYNLGVNLPANCIVLCTHLMRYSAFNPAGATYFNCCIGVTGMNNELMIEAVNLLETGISQPQAPIAPFEIFTTPKQLTLQYATDAPTLAGMDEGEMGIFITIFPVEQFQKVVGNTTMTLPPYFTFEGLVISGAEGDEITVGLTENGDELGSGTIGANGVIKLSGVHFSPEATTIYISNSSTENETLYRMLCR